MSLRSKRIALYRPVAAARAFEIISVAKARPSEHDLKMVRTAMSTSSERSVTGGLVDISSDRPFFTPRLDAARRIYPSNFKALSKIKAWSLSLNVILVRSAQATLADESWRPGDRGHLFALAGSVPACFWGNAHVED